MIHCHLKIVPPTSFLTCETMLLPKYQPKRGGDLGWGKLFRFKCGIKNYFQLAKTNLRTQFNCNIDMIENQTQAYISNWISKR